MLHTSVSLAAFDLFHQTAEALMGRPVWTHEFANEGIAQQLSDLAAAALPEITEVEHPDDWMAGYRGYIEAVRERFGDEVEIAVPEQRPPDMAEVLSSLPADKPVLAVVLEDEADEEES
jgi:hypothetical protein